IIPPKILVGILYYKQKIKEKFKQKSSDKLSIKILLNIISDQTHNIIKKSINWDSKVDFKNIDQGMKEVIRYYFYLIILYLVIISILFFFIDMEKTGLHDAKERIQIEDRELPIKDEIIEMHLNKIYKNVPYPLKGKILECGTTNCLVAINVENFIYKGKSPQIHKKYIVKPIKNDSYLNQINSFQDLPEI
ncbi:hypothetical protein ACIF8R_13720, partial [Acinetobacter sp. ABJ_C4_1]|uniref:hypothetical protein n=1 Tax=Acinetobacter sp. ABJ_C4_1 TaxID=3377080 RepID=UPI0037C8115B